MVFRMAVPGDKVNESATSRARSISAARKRLYNTYNGYVRVPNPERLANGRSGGTSRKGSYKKGWELRLVVPADGLERARQLIVAAGLTPARPFVKGRQIIQPIYGYEPVMEYLELTASDEELQRVQRIAGQ
jgi:hypothetical protein